MRWHPKKIHSGRILLACSPDRLPEWDFSGFDGMKVGVGCKFAGMDACFIPVGGEIDPESRNTYTNDPRAEWMRGVRYCPTLRGIEAHTAAIMLAMRLGASQVVVVGSDIEDSAAVVNANPDTLGCHPSAFGISPPEDLFREWRSAPVPAGFGAIPRFCEGRRVFILGGGPSLAELDLSKLDDEIVLGVNDAYKLPCTDYAYFGDHRWGKTHADALAAFRGLVWTTSNVDHPAVVKIQPAPNRFSTDNSYVAINGNSGFGAMNVAALGGASEIVLLGFDMKPEGSRTNWHDDNISTVGSHNYEIYKQAAKQLAVDIGRAFPGLKVLNANPDSAMNAFEKIDPNDVIPGLKE